MTLAEALLVGAENQRHVRELRHGHAERFEQQHVLRRVRNVIVAANHLRDPHVHVIGDHRQVIRRIRIRSQDHEIFDIRVVEIDRAVDEIEKLRTRLAEL